MVDTGAGRRGVTMRAGFRLPRVLLGLSPRVKALAAHSGMIAEFWEVAPRLIAKVPLMVARVACGFPSPADDYIERVLCFNDLLNAHLPTVFAVRSAGDSMIGAGIFDGDIVVVNKALTAHDMNIIVGLLGDEFTIKRYRCKGDRCWLQAENPAYPDIPITEDSGFEVWGVVKNSIRSY